MSIANKTKQPLVIRQALAMGYIEDAKRPILSAADRLKGGYEIKPHHHPRAQLAHCDKGVLQVVTPQGTWLIPPTQAVWIPSDLQHHVRAEADVYISHLFIDASYCQRFPDQCQVIEVSPFLQSLINRLVERGNDYQDQGQSFRLARVLLDELQAMQNSPLYLPLAQDRRIKMIMQQLSLEPSDNRNLEQWANIAGASSRTIGRIFKQETGLSFQAWRQQLRLQHAINALSQGESVTNVALNLGYQSSSAFIAMFKQQLGLSPSRYLRQLGLAET